jgi:hypothetical protein
MWVNMPLLENSLQFRAVIVTVFAEFLPCRSADRVARSRQYMALIAAGHTVACSAGAEVRGFGARPLRKTQ